MKILDNVLPEKQFLDIHSLVMGPNFPWYYGARTYEGSKTVVQGWTHTVLSASDRVVYSQARPIYNAVLDMLKTAEETPCNVIRIRILANTTVPEPHLRGIHVDFNLPHHSAVFYFNDTDGGTVIYKDRYVEGEDVPGALELLDIVEPKANRIVCFNGLHYHSGTLPVVSARRVVMNINYVKDEQ